MQTVHAAACLLSQTFWRRGLQSGLINLTGELAARSLVGLCDVPVMACEGDETSCWGASLSVYSVLESQSRDLRCKPIPGLFYFLFLDVVIGYFLSQISPKGPIIVVILSP